MSIPSPDPGETEPAAGGLEGEPQPASAVQVPLSRPESVALEEPVADQAGPAAQPSPAPDGWALIALVPYDGLEPPGDARDELAQAVWCAISALWHPALLSHASALPRIEPVESPSVPGGREIRVIASGSEDRLPSGYKTSAEDAGAALIESGTERPELIRLIQARIRADGAAETAEDDGMRNAAHDFLALGTVRWFLRDLTTAMGHVDLIEAECLNRELLAGAHAWRIGDWTSAVNRLRAAFEVLTQARERFYPADAYLIDLCLLDQAMPGGVLGDPLERPVAISFIMPAKALENQAMHDPHGLAALRQAIAAGWADVAGGGYSEAEDPLLPLESMIWQFRRGADVYRLHLDERTVESVARRRFGLYPQLPQFARRFGFRYALHMAFDGGRFPMRGETKRLWESPDGSSLESLLRPPLAADRAAQGWLVPWRMAASLKNDHVAALPLLHWPSPVASWYLDLRRAAAYSPVLGRWTTLNDFFQLTDRPYETFRPEGDDYQTPYLSQGVGRREDRPITRISRHHRMRARLEAARSMQALARAIACSAVGTVAEPEAPEGLTALEEIESLIETGRQDEAGTALNQVEPAWAQILARRIAGAASGVAAGATDVRRPGYLVLNPLNVPRRAAVILPDAPLDLRPTGPLRAAQFTDEGVYAVVELPAFGFAWISSDTTSGGPPAIAAGVNARGRKFRNESIEVEIDSATGGIRSVAGVGDAMARLGQQLVFAGLSDAQGRPLASQMRSERFEIEYGGPALVQATSKGTLVDPRDGASLASFAQRYRLWAGRPIFEIDITLLDLDPTWLARAAAAEPWSVYLACRWAWPDPSSMLRRTSFWSPELTEAERPETPDVLDISTRNQRTALLFNGLSYHRKHGARMLDTLLVAGLEVSRSFSLGVALDLEHPFHAASDLNTPAIVVPMEDGPPAAGTTGWLAKIDQKTVAVSHLGFAETTTGEKGWGLVFHLLETGGQAARCRLRLFRNPASARQVDFQGETLIDLSIQDDAVLIDLTPHELACVEVTMA
jgi:alpha-mannosidase